MNKLKLSEVQEFLTHGELHVIIDFSAKKIITSYSVTPFMMEVTADKWIKDKMLTPKQVRWINYARLNLGTGKVSCDSLEIDYKN